MNTLWDLLDEDEIKSSNYGKVWEQHLGIEIAKKQILHPITNSKPEERGYVRFVLISDTHTMHQKLVLPEADILIHSGDFTQTGHREEIVAI